MSDILFYDFLDEYKSVETLNSPLKVVALFPSDFNGFFSAGLMTGEIFKTVGTVQQTSHVFLEGQWDVFSGNPVYVLVTFAREEDDAQQLLIAFDLLYTCLTSKGFAGSKVDFLDKVSDIKNITNQSTPLSFKAAREKFLLADRVLSGRTHEHKPTRKI